MIFRTYDSLMYMMILILSHNLEFSQHCGLVALMPYGMVTLGSSILHSYAVTLYHEMQADVQY